MMEADTASLTVYILLQRLLLVKYTTPIITGILLSLPRQWGFKMIQQVIPTIEHEYYITWTIQSHIRQEKSDHISFCINQCTFCTNVDYVQGYVWGIFQFLQPEELWLMKAPHVRNTVIHIFTITHKLHVTNTLIIMSRIWLMNG